MSQKGKAWVFTVNNYTDEDVEYVKACECRCIVVGREVGENGTPHLQGAVVFANALTMKGIKKRLGKRAHVEKMRGTWEESVTYCTKDADVLRHDGEPPSTQGKRNDIAEFTEAIANGLTEVEAYEQFPGMMAKYPKYYGGYKDAKQRATYRSTMTKCTWYWGETGTGKSHQAFENYDPATWYVHEDSDKGWWDGYDGQETVVINEYRGKIDYAQLLSLIDKWPKKVSRRGREPCPFVAKHVIITCPMTPEQCYAAVGMTDSIEQLLRRVQVIHCTQVYQE